MHAMRTLSSACSSDRQDLYDRVEHHYADGDGVQIHYVTVGQRPLVVMIHGFPDYWYTWRHQMEALSKDHRVAAMDMRGYNRSDNATASMLATSSSPVPTRSSPRKGWRLG